MLFLRQKFHSIPETVNTQGGTYTIKIRKKNYRHIVCLKLKFISIRWFHYDFIMTWNITLKFIKNFTKHKFFKCTLIHAMMTFIEIYKSKLQIKKLQKTLANICSGFNRMKMLKYNRWWIRQQFKIEDS